MKLSPHQDLTFEPFSRRGSYLNIRRLDADSSPRTERRGLYLRQCHGARFLEPIVAKLTLNGKDPESEWDASTLTLRDPESNGVVSIVFDGMDNLRLRGSDCVLEMDFETGLGTSMYPAGGTAWEINARPCLQKFRLGPLAGDLQAATDWHGEQSHQMVARFVPGTDGTWEGYLDMYSSTRLHRAFRNFETCQADVRADFAAFLDALPACDPAFEAARARAAYVNWTSIVHPCGLFKRPAMLMSKNHMANVWSWDHAFNAMAHMAGEPEFAWDQMMLMADRQNEHGAFPDAHNDVHEHFSFCKPPIHGWALSNLRRSRPDFFTPDRLREALSWLEPWTRWWLNHRVWEDGDLPYYLHGNDSGWDNSTFFLKGVPVLTPDLPCFLILQCRELAAIHRLLGQAVDAAFWTAQADRLLAAVLSDFWNGERFIAKHLPSGEVLQADTLIETIPLVLGDELPEEIRAKVISRLHRYLTPHGPATEWPESPHYTPDGYWRGPIWAPSTYLIVDGLRRGGETAFADDIAARFCRLCAASGFAENFDALTGAPLRDKAYTWTSSVFLLLTAKCCK